MVKTDGQKIYDALSSNLKRSRVSPEVKKDKILSQFSIIKDTKILNEYNMELNKTPLKHFTQFLYDRIYKSIKYTSSSEDYLGRFYGEFFAHFLFNSDVFFLGNNTPIFHIFSHMHSQFIHDNVLIIFHSSSLLPHSILVSSKSCGRCRKLWTFFRSGDRWSHKTPSDSLNIGVHSTTSACKYRSRNAYF